MIAKQLSGVGTACDTQPSPGNEWEDWVFEESRRRLDDPKLTPLHPTAMGIVLIEIEKRLSVIYRVVNMLVYFEPAAMCDLPTDLLLAPLPARKQLWEAGDEFAWKSERGRDPGAHATAFGLTANGELFRLYDSDRLYCGSHMELVRQRSVNDCETPSSSAENWEEWCSGMDGMGGLVMLAASLVG